MVTYDSKILQEFAERLYKKARQIVVKLTTIGVILGGLIGYVLAIQSHNTTTNNIYLIVGALLGGGIGFAIGQEIAFKLRIQAQTVLCQVKIEENTRK